MIARRGRRWRLAATGLASLGLALSAAAEPPVEYKVQAAYVSKFLLFVEWPEGTVGEAGYVVGVAGRDDFWEAMQVLGEREVASARVTTRRVRSAEAVAGIHVLVVDPDHPRAATDALLAAAAEKPVLSVGRADDFAARGGVVQFVIVEDTLRFGVNLDAAERAGLEVSSRLMRAARPLEGAAPGGGTATP